MTTEQAERIVDAILRDLQDRSGIKHAWDEIDADIQDEIRATWLQIVLATSEE